MDAVGRKLIVANDGAAFIQYDERRGGLSPGVLVRLLVQVPVKLGYARMESKPIVRGIQGLGGIFEVMRANHREANF